MASMTVKTADLQTNGLNTEAFPMLFDKWNQLIHSSLTTSIIVNNGFQKLLRVKPASLLTAQGSNLIIIDRGTIHISED